MRSVNTGFTFFCCYFTATYGIYPPREMNISFVNLETSRASNYGRGIGEHDRSFEKERTRYSTLLELIYEFSIPV